MALISISLGLFAISLTIPHHHKESTNLPPVSANRLAVTVVVLSFVTDLYGFCNVAHTFPDVI
jgi:uncharacterized membrane protein YidH (DUF202 family)